MGRYVWTGKCERCGKDVRKESEEKGLRLLVCKECVKKGVVVFYCVEDLEKEEGWGKRAFE